LRFWIWLSLGLSLAACDDGFKPLDPPPSNLDELRNSASAHGCRLLLPTLVDHPESIEIFDFYQDAQRTEFKYQSRNGDAVRSEHIVRCGLSKDGRPYLQYDEEVFQPLTAGFAVDVPEKGGFELPGARHNYWGKTVDIPQFVVVNRGLYLKAQEEEFLNEIAVSPLFWNHSGSLSEAKVAPEIKAVQDRYVEETLREMLREADLIANGDRRGDDSSMTAEPSVNIGVSAARAGLAEVDPNEPPRLSIFLQFMRSHVDHLCAQFILEETQFDEEDFPEFIRQGRSEFLAEYQFSRRLEHGSDLTDVEYIACGETEDEIFVFYAGEYYFKDDLRGIIEKGNWSQTGLM